MRTSDEVRANGVPVTAHDTFGGLSLGFLLDGDIWIAGDGYMAVRAQDDVFGLKDYDLDGGQAYFESVHGIVEVA